MIDKLNKLIQETEAISLIFQLQNDEKRVSQFDASIRTLKCIKRELIEEQLDKQIISKLNNVISKNNKTEESLRVTIRNKKTLAFGKYILTELDFDTLTQQKLDTILSNYDTYKNKILQILISINKAFAVSQKAFKKFDGQINYNIFISNDLNIVLELDKKTIKKGNIIIFDPSQIDYIKLINVQINRLNILLKCPEMS